MRLATRYLWILALVGALLGTQSVALLHAQAHGQSHDWVNEQLGEHACAVIDQLAGPTPPAHASVQLPIVHSVQNSPIEAQSWVSNKSLAWGLARAPPMTRLLHTPAASNANVLL